MFVCETLINGFCQRWIEIDPIPVVGAPISASVSSLNTVDLIQAFGLGFSLSGSVFLVAFAARTIRRALLDIF